MRTRDLYFASYLTALGHTLTKAERPADNPRVMLFHFSIPSAEFEALKLGYLTGQTLVPARAFVDALKNLKNLVHRVDD